MTTTDVIRRNNVRVTGDAGGKAIVFGHGFGCSQDMWRLVAPRFEHDHSVVLLDHVGAGDSDTAAYDPERHGSLDGYVDDLIEVADELRIQDGVFVGHSVSAMIGILAHVRRPDVFGELVLVGPSPRYLDDDGYRGGFGRADMDELIELIDRNYEGWAAAMAPAIMGNADRPELAEELEGSFCRTDPVIARQFARVTFLSDNRDDLAKVSARTLVLQSSDDVIAPAEVGAFVAATIPDSRLVHLTATGHCPNLSAPDETAESIRAFLAVA